MYRFATTMMMFALAFGLQSAYAAPPGDAPSVVIHFAGLDLSGSDGAKLLYRRLNGAAETVCAQFDGRDIPRHANFKACVRTAVATAVATVNRPALTEYYEGGNRNATIQIARQ
jgi:UrcA family protein